MDEDVEWVRPIWWTCVGVPCGEGLLTTESVGKAGIFQAALGLVGRTSR